ncbi:MAG: hypothetical protein K2P99_01600, partial [Burkholderiales bacterium]|nr:hypothetical protein [Burkholderiales bacterium]
TGLGSRGYAVIEQGMISRIIESKPDELKVYLEEVAGISKYKEKRKETLSKLHDTKENLIRIEYINHELEKQISILTVQADDAHKYQNLQHELKLQQFIINQLKISKAGNILDEVNTNLEIINEQLLKIDDENTINDIKLADILVVKTRKEAELATLTNDFNQLRTNIARLEERKEHNKNLQNRLATDKINLSGELVELDDQISNALQNILELNMQVDNNNFDIEAKQLTRENSIESLEQLESEYQQVNEMVSSWVGEIQNKKHELDLLNNSLEHKNQQLNNVEYRLKKLEQEKADNILDFNQSYNVTKDEITELEIELLHLDEELEKAKTSRVSLDLDISNLVNNLHEIKSELSAKHSTIATISELLSKENSKTNSIEGIIKNRVNLQPLWKNIVVLVGYELALEVALGELLNAFYIDDVQDIKRIPQQLTTLWLNSHKSSKPSVFNNLHEATTLDKFVTIKDKCFSKLYHLLSEFIVCDNFEIAIPLLANILINQKIITKDGHYLSKNYIIFNANSAENHVLEYQNKLFVLENESRILASKLAKLETQLQENKLTFAKHEHNVKRLDSLYKENYKKKHDLQLQLTKEEQIYIQNKQYQEKVIQEYKILNNEISSVNREIEEI